MYLSFYNLQEMPFRLNTDPRFLWLGRQHLDIISTLKYKTAEYGGLVVLTGDVGTGKTTLIHALLDSLGDNISAGVITDPGFKPLEFFGLIANAFHLSGNFDSKAGFMSLFSRFLQESQQSSRMVLLVVDEAQRAGDDVLEELRHLLNLENDHKRLLTLLLAGQNEFYDLLLQENCRPLRQRIAFHYQLEPLSQDETGAYIRQRMQIAGATDDIFKTDALREIFHFTQGYPRLINIISDLALLTGFSREQKTVDAKIVKDCAGKLRLLDRHALAQRNRPAWAVSPKSEVRQSGSSLTSRLNAATIVWALIALGLVLISYYAAERVFKPRPARVAEVVETSQNSLPLQSSTTPSGPAGPKLSANVLPSNDRQQNAIGLLSNADSKVLGAGELHGHSDSGPQQQASDPGGRLPEVKQIQNSAPDRATVSQASQNLPAVASLQTQSDLYIAGPNTKNRHTHSQIEPISPAPALAPLVLEPMPLQQPVKMALFGAQMGLRPLPEIEQDHPSDKAHLAISPAAPTKKKAPPSSEKNFTRMLLEEIDAMQERIRPESQTDTAKGTASGSMDEKKDASQPQSEATPSAAPSPGQQTPPSGPEALIDRVLKDRSR